MSEHLQARWSIALICVALFFGGGANAAAQVTTGNVTGSVRDSQGGVVPGALVTLTSATRGTAMDAHTNANGDFLFPNVTADTYLIKVSLDGFKAVERGNVAVSPGDRVAVGTLTLEVGGTSETITVAGDTPIIQASSGERSFTVSTEAVENLPLNTRNWASFTSLTPGVVGTTRLAMPGRRTTRSWSTASRSWIRATTARCCRPTSTPLPRSRC